MEKWKVSASDIKNWTATNKRLSEEELPHLIRKLIMSSVIPEEIKMPSGDSVFTPGWDGFLKTKEKHAYIPTGVTCWEMGTNAKVGTKASTDFKKRTEETDIKIRQNTVYIFVTTRNWGRKKSWLEEAKIRKEWKDVRAYNANDLEAWLELCPSVHIWFANLLGKRFENVFDSEQAWSSWANITSPSISSELVLHSREKPCEELEKALKDSPQIIRLVSDSYSECFGFSLACLNRIPKYSARALVIENQTSWNNLVSKKGSMILIPNFKTPPDNIALAINNGHWVILPVNRLENNADGAIQLHRVPKKDSESILVKMGLNEDDAREVISETNGFLMPIRRNKRLNNGAPVTPDWIQEENLVKVAMGLLFVGSWNSKCIGDQEVICSIVGIDSYEEIEQKLHILSQYDDSPCRKSNEKWATISRLDIWSLLGARITINQFEKYSSSLQSALMEDDPMRDAEKKILLTFQNVKEKYSNDLLLGMTEFLPILSCLGKNICKNFGNYSIESRVSVLVRTLFEEMNSKDHWLYAESFFSHFAECAPDSFLNALENDLEREEPFVLELFQKENSGIFGGCHHSHLLWGLEIISWNKNFFTRVVHLLAKLAEIDPGGNYSNRPINTLKDFFRIWLPQTHATVDQRIDVLKTLYDEHPDTLWKILCSIYQRYGNLATYIASPKYQNWKDGYKDGVTINDNFTIKGFELIFLFLKNNFSVDKGKFVLGLLHKMPPEKQIETLSFFEQTYLLSLDQKRELSLEFEKLLSSLNLNNERRPEISMQAQQKLNEIKQDLLDDDLIGKHLHTFSQDFEMSFFRKTKDLNKAITLARVEQKNSLDQIIEKGQIEDVFILSSKVRNPSVIGSLLAEHQSEDYVFDIISLALKNNQIHSLMLLSGILNQLFYKEPVVEELYLKLSKDWETDECIRFLCCLPFQTRTYSLVLKSSNQVQEKYWELFKPWLPQVDDFNLIPLILKKLLAAKRQYTALEQVSIYLHNNTNLDSALVAEILEQVAFGETHEQIPANISYFILELFKFIYKKNEIAEDQLLQLEWAFLKVFDRTFEERVPPTIFKRIKSDPCFFIEIISYVFKANPPIENEFSHLQPDLLEQRAALGYTALELIDDLPFEISEDHEASFQRGYEWISKALEQAKEVNRVKVTERRIGSLLSLSPLGTDGIWPHEAIRKIIEKIGNESIFSGFSTSYYNRYHGKFQLSSEVRKTEQERSKSLRKDGNALAFTHHKTSRLLLMLAESIVRGSDLFPDDD